MPSPRADAPPVRRQQEVRCRAPHAEPGRRARGLACNHLLAIATGPLPVVALVPKVDQVPPGHVALWCPRCGVWNVCHLAAAPVAGSVAADAEGAA